MSKRLHRSQSGFTILELMIATTIVSTILLIATGVMIGIQDVYTKGLTQEGVQNDVQNLVSQISQEIQDNSGVIQNVTLPFSIGLSVEKGAPAHIYTEQALCIGSVRYLYVQGLRVGTGPTDTYQALVRGTTPTEGCGYVNSAGPPPHGPGHGRGPGFGPGPGPWGSYGCSGTYDPANILCPPPPSAAGTQPTGTAYVASGAILTDFQVNQLLPGRHGGGANQDGNWSISVGMSIGNYDLFDTTAKAQDGTYGNGTFINNPDILCKGSTGFQFCATSSLTTEVGQRVQ